MKILPPNIIATHLFVNELQKTYEKGVYINTLYLEKALKGIYVDNKENQRKNRVGVKYDYTKKSKNKIDLTEEISPIKFNKNIHPNLKVIGEGTVYSVYHGSFDEFYKHDNTKGKNFVDSSFYHYGTKKAAKEKNKVVKRANLYADCWIELNHDIANGGGFTDESINLYKWGIISREEIGILKENLYKGNFEANIKILKERFKKYFGTDKVGFKYKNEVEDKGSWSYAVLDNDQITILSTNIEK